MPLQSTMSADEKNRVKSVLSPSNKILMATVARIYYAHPDPNSWTFSGEQGGLAFVKDKNSGLYYFRLVDLQGTRGVLWEHELYEGFVLNEDRPFFHSFAGDDCMIGLVYTDESEASSFLKVVSKKRSSVNKAKTNAAKKKAKNGKGKILKSLISAPQAGSFKHVSHMGYDSEKGFTSDNVDPSWMAFLNQLEEHGVDAALIAENMDFIKDFVRDAQQPKPVKSASTGAKKPPAQKPPAPPSLSTRKKTQKGQKPPAPPPPRRGHGQTDSVTSVQTPVEASSKPAAAPPTPPAPPAPPAAPAPPVRSAPNAAPPAPPAPPRSSGAPPAPPLPPGRPGISNGGPPPAPPPPPPGPPVAGAPPPPPPPPPAPPSMGGPPPPPPPPPPSGAAPPPPPPPPPGGAPSAPSPNAALPQGRSALLESIQGKGVHALRKTTGPREPSMPVGRVAGEPAPASPSAVATEEAAGGGGDLAAALAAALTQRNKKLGDSDDEDDEEEWD